MIRNAPILALLLVAACARSEEANLVPSDGNETREVETVRPERDDQELALGAWRDTLQEEQGALEFGPGGAAPCSACAATPAAACCCSATAFRRPATCR